MEGKDLQAAFSDTKLSEKSKGPLKSGTWQKAKEVLQDGISEMDVDASASAGGSGGFTQGAWIEALHEYVRTSYKDDGSLCDIETGGVTYKVMKKDDKVTFYDATGNTLFHVAYEQLEKEYAQMMGQQGADREDCQIKRQIGESGEAALGCSGGVGEEWVKDNMPGDPSSGKGSSGPAKDRAKKKLEKELEKAKDRSFAEPVIGYLIKRCGEDEGLSQDVIQEHKTWEKCYAYIYSEARKIAQKGTMSCAVRDDVVYGWAEDYYHKDDKAEEEERVKRAAEARKKAGERKAKAKEGAAKKAGRAREDPSTKIPDGAKAVPEGVEKGDAKPKKNIRDMEGQMDMFSMMGI